MEITEEQRVAVLVQACAEQGHLIDIDEAISDDPGISDHMPTINVRARDGDSLPHLRCRRCPMVWLVMPGIAGYDAAEQALNDLLAPKNRRKLRRDRRRERADAERVATEKAAADQAAAEKAAAELAAQSPAPTPPAPTPAPAPGE